MYVRIIRGQTQPGQADALAQQWQQFVLPRMQRASGLRQAYFAVNREANMSVGVSLWESRPDEATLNPLVEEFRAQAGELVAGQPTIEQYEVVVES